MKTPFLTKFTYRGLIASPHVVAWNKDGRVSIVRLYKSVQPATVDRLDHKTAELDAWVVLSRANRQDANITTGEAWLVYDQGARFELPPMQQGSYAHAELALKTLRETGRFEMTTAELAAILCKHAAA